MYIAPIKTHKIAVSESLEKFLDRYLINIVEGDIIAITSKILSLMEGRVVQKDSIDKYTLICKESDYVLESDHNPYNIHLTIKNDILIPSAGIDESNVDNVYVLYPENIQKTASFIWNYLRNKYQINHLGILITDSHTTIMRKGVTGIALGWCGFMPLYSYINKPDIYGRKLKVTETNILDSLAVSSVFIMGEGDEQTPLAIIKNAPKISFLDRVPNKKEEKSVRISLKEDLYAPLLQSGKWLKF